MLCGDIGTRAPLAINRWLLINPAPPLQRAARVSGPALPHLHTVAAPGSDVLRCQYPRIVRASLLEATCEYSILADGSSFAYRLQPSCHALLKVLCQEATPRYQEPGHAETLTFQCSQHQSVPASFGQWYRNGQNHKMKKC